MPRSFCKQSAPRTTTIASNTGYDVLVPDFELGAGRCEEGASITPETNEEGKHDVPLVFRTAAAGASSAGYLDWAAHTAA